jgi:hypothetical protein
MFDQNVEVVAGGRGSQDLPHVGIAKVCLNVRFIGHQPGEDMIMIAIVLIFRVGEPVSAVVNKPGPVPPENV